jgi:hypothetical protein
LFLFGSGATGQEDKDAASQQQGFHRAILFWFSSSYENYPLKKAGIGEIDTRRWHDKYLPGVLPFTGLNVWFI